MNARQSCFNADHHSPHTREELRDDVFQFVENLSADTGVKINPDGVWKELQTRMVKPSEDTDAAALPQE